MHKQVVSARGSEVGSPVVAKVVPSSRSCHRGFPLRSHTKIGRGSSPNPKRASLVISTLEALAVLVALKLRYGEEPGRSEERVRIAPTLTDRGIEAALKQAHDD